MNDYWICDGCGERVDRDGPVAVADLRAKLSRALDVLRAVEWEGCCGVPYDGCEAACPSCDATAESGAHNPGCRLWEVIKP